MRALLVVLLAGCDVVIGEAELDIMFNGMIMDASGLVGRVSGSSRVTGSVRTNGGSHSVDFTI